MALQHPQHLQRIPYQLLQRGKRNIFLRQVFVDHASRDRESHDPRPETACIATNERRAHL